MKATDMNHNWTRYLASLENGRTPRLFFATMATLATIGVLLGLSSQSVAQDRSLPSFPLTKQPDNISCGAASAVMVLKYYGINAGVGPVKTDAGTRWLAVGNENVGMTFPNGLRDALNQRGVRSQVRNVSLNDLVSIVRDGRPAVVLVRSGVKYWHWFVVYGYSDNGEEFHISDPSGKQYSMSAKRLNQAMTFSHDTSGRPTGGRKCATCEGDGQMTNLDCPACTGGWITERFTGFKTKCLAGCNGGRITARCQVCGGSGDSPDMFRKAVETAGVSGHTAVVPVSAPRPGGSGKSGGGGSAGGKSGGGSSSSGKSGGGSSGSGKSGGGNSSSANNGNSISYTITNDSRDAVTLTFSPSNNTSRLSPGRSTTATSFIRNGEYPQVTARTSGGARWTRTITQRNGRYRIVNRESGGIQIVN
jgi:hypothetical protein